MPATIQDLLANQEAKLEALQKRLAMHDAVAAQHQQERNALVADIIEARGKLDGLKEALATTMLSGEKGEGNARADADQGQGGTGPSEREDTPPAQDGARNAPRPNGSHESEHGA